MSTPVEKFFSDPGWYLAHDYYLKTRVRAVQEVVAPEGGRRILDVGCGDGRMSLAVLRAGDRLTMVDSSAKMLEMAEKNLRSVRMPEGATAKTLHADLRDLSENDQYDLVMALGVLAHAADTDRILGGLASMVRSGGSLVIQITDSSTMLGRLLLAYDAGKEKISKRRGYMLTRVRADALTHACAAHGLALGAELRFGFDPPGLRRILSDSALLWMQNACIDSPILNRMTSDRIMRFVRKE